MQITSNIRRLWKYQNKNQIGVILMVVMVLTLVMAIIAISILGMGLYSYQQATFYEDFNQALYTAEAGINYSIAKTTTTNASGFNMTSSTTGSLQYAAFYVVGSTLSNNTVELISTATVYRLDPRVRQISVQIYPGDNPWKHFIWQGCGGAPAGNDNTGYPSGYNSTSNGPKYDTGGIGALGFDSQNKWEPYYGLITSKKIPNAIYIGKDTTIINWSLSTSGTVFQFATTGNFGGASNLPTWIKSSIGQLNLSWSNPSTYTAVGAYTGMVYIQGEVNISGNDLSIYGQLFSVGGNIIINKQELTVMMNTTNNAVLSSFDRTGTSYLSYVTLACIDTSASNLCDDSIDLSNQGAGQIIQGTGNSTLQVGNIGNPNYPGGAVYCSNLYGKNGQGTEVNGVIMTMGNDINGYPSGNYYFDPLIYQNAPILGVDVSEWTQSNYNAGTWRELPVGWSL